MLRIKHISLCKANEYVNQNHRHHSKVQGHKFSLCVYDGDRLCGVSIVGHPQSRFLDDGETLEVLRLCTDGTKNACSILYGRCAKIAKEMGYEKIVTFTLESENGSSLKASGWNLVDTHCGGFRWGGKREEERGQFKQLSFIPQKQPPNEYKQRWEKSLI